MVTGERYACSSHPLRAAHPASTTISADETCSACAPRHSHSTTPTGTWRRDELAARGRGWPWRRGRSRSAAGVATARVIRSEVRPPETKLGYAPHPPLPAGPCRGPLALSCQPSGSDMSHHTPYHRLIRRARRPNPCPTWRASCCCYERLEHLRTHAGSCRSRPRNWRGDDATAWQRPTDSSRCGPFSVTHSQRARSRAG